MRAITLHQLFDTAHPEASFHDSELQSLEFRFTDLAVVCRFLIPIGYEDRRPVYRPGVLTFSQVCFFAIEPPASPASNWSQGSLWITSDGPYPDPAVAFDVPIPPDLPDRAFCHYLYSSDTNSFVVLAALSASFEWSADTPRA